MRDPWTSARPLRLLGVPLTLALTGALTVVAMPAAQTAAAPGASPASAGLGTTWVDRSAQFSGSNWKGVAYGNGLFVAASPSGTNGAGDRIMRSTDGATWTRSSLSGGAEGGSVAFGDDTFVSVMENAVIWASSDGLTWTRTASSGGTNKWLSVTYGHGSFHSVAFAGAYPSGRSTDGVNWSDAGLAYASGAWGSVVVGDDTVVAVDGSKIAFTTAGSTTWTIIGAPKSANWNSLAYGAGLFVAVSDDSVMTSPNGHTWTLRNAAENNYWTSVTYAAGMFVAVSSNGTNRVMTSTDGITWAARSSPQRGWRAVTYGNGGFVAVGDAGAVMTSGIAAGLTPTLDTAVRTSDGFTVNVTNYDPAYTWTPTVGAGSVTTGTASGGILPLTVTGLGAAGSATLTVTTSQTGYTNGTATSPRPAVTSPSAPTITGVTPGDSHASVAFSAPVNDGGGTVTRIEFALDDTSTVDDSTTGPSPYSLAGLVNGTSHIVYARAVNAAGAGAWSLPSDPFMPQGLPPPPVRAAGPPQDVNADAGQGLATVSWSPPADSGSFPVSHYRVQGSPSGTCLVAGGTSCVVKGLRNGVDYTFRVQALTGAGWGAWSTPSDRVSPVGPGSTPSIVISGSRRDVRGMPGITVTGTTTEKGAEAMVTPWSANGGRAFRAGSPTLVGADGRFAWSRRASERATWKIYMTMGELRSNVVTIRPPR